MTSNITFRGFKIFLEYEKDFAQVRYGPYWYLQWRPPGLKSSIIKNLGDHVYMYLWDKMGQYDYYILLYKDIKSHTEEYKQFLLKQVLKKML